MTLTRIDIDEDALAEAEAAAPVTQTGRTDLRKIPLITIDGHTVFGPVLTTVPAPDKTLAVFDAVATLVLTPEFSQLHRPRNHA